MSEGTATYRFDSSGTSAAGLTLADVERGLASRPREVHLGTLGLVLEPGGEALATENVAVGVESLGHARSELPGRAAIRDRTADLDRRSAPRPGPTSSR